MRPEDGASQTREGVSYSIDGSGQLGTTWGNQDRHTFDNVIGFKPIHESGSIPFSN